MVTVDRYIGGSLSYIAFNILRRAIFEESKKAANLAPIQNKGSYCHQPNEIQFTNDYV